MHACRVANSYKQHEGPYHNPSERLVISVASDLFYNWHEECRELCILIHPPLKRPSRGLDEWIQNRNLTAEEILESGFRSSIKGTNFPTYVDRFRILFYTFVYFTVTLYVAVISRIATSSNMFPKMS
jgi:hypothetical protein